MILIIARTNIWFYFFFKKKKNIEKGDKEDGKCKKK